MNLTMKFLMIGLLINSASEACTVPSLSGVTFNPECTMGGTVAPLAQCTITCETGYERVGVSTGAQTVTCQSSGSFNPVPVSCTAPDEPQVTASGVGLEAPTVGKETSFTVAMNGQTGDVDITSDQETKFTTTASDNDETRVYTYMPINAGRLKITVKLDQVEITGSSFTVNVAKGTDSSAPTATGSGLKTATVGVKASFMVTMNGPTGDLTIASDKDTDLKFMMKTNEDNDDSSREYTYTPIKAGTLQFSVKLSESHIRGSPFTVIVAEEKSNDKENPNEVNFANKMTSGSVLLGTFAFAIWTLTLN